MGYVWGRIMKRNYFLSIFDKMIIGPFLLGDTFGKNTVYIAHNCLMLKFKPSCALASWVTLVLWPLVIYIGHTYLGTDTRQMCKWPQIGMVRNCRIDPFRWIEIRYANSLICDIGTIMKIIMNKKKLIGTNFFIKKSACHSIVKIFPNEQKGLK